jgi:hypothetical protein
LIFSKYFSRSARRKGLQRGNFTLETNAIVAEKVFAAAADFVQRLGCMR